MINAEIIKYLHQYNETLKSIIISKIVFFIFRNESDKISTVLGGCAHIFTYAKT